MNFLLAVDGYLLKYLGNVIFNGLFSVINAWLVMHLTIGTVD
jgi:hypothetical protein